MNALIVVDVQNDFLPGGNLAVPHGDQVIAPINTLIDRADDFHVIVATQDWHPAGHKSFASSHPGHAIGQIIQLNGLTQVLWPDHCIQHTRGAALANSLHTARITKCFPKGQDPLIDSYSGLFDNGHRRSTGLAQWLRAQGVTSIVVVGLATDYCVKATAIDAATEGFDTTVILDACRAVELAGGDTNRAIAEMQAASVRILQSIADFAASPKLASIPRRQAP